MCFVVCHVISDFVKKTVDGSCPEIFVEKSFRAKVASSDTSPGKLNGDGILPGIGFQVNPCITGKREVC